VRVRWTLLIFPLTLLSCTIDPDDDGVNKRTEIAWGTDQHNADTDNDGIDDGDEARLGTDPNNDDTDQDGVLDGAELEAGTDPLDSDSDDDTLTDGEEAELGTDPLSVDTDGDKISDADELELGTDPTDADTDDDKLDDGDDYHLGTDPLDPDTDHDGVLDGDEVEAGTNPLQADSDQDGYTDGEEIAAGTDPLDRDDRIYIGGWPWYMDKDSLTEPVADSKLAVDERIPRWHMDDQHLQSLDFYDLAGADVPIAVVLGASGAPSHELSDQLDGEAVALEGLEDLADAVKNGEILVVHVLVRGAEEGPPTARQLQLWHAEHPNLHVPLLADVNGKVADWADGLSLPAVLHLDSDLIVLSSGEPLDTLTDVLAAR
jgi:hypothetical protein